MRSTKRTVGALVATWVSHAVGFVSSAALVVSGPVLLAQNTLQIREANQDSVVFIHSQKTRRDGSTSPQHNYGTGFIIPGQGYILTASHVIFEQDPDSVVETTASIRSRFNQSYRVELVKRDLDVDGALLLLPEVGVQWKPVSLGASSGVPNDAQLYALGFPGSSDLSPALGILSNHFGPGGTWQTTLQIDKGDSGGPVFDMNGKVVAVAMAGQDESRAITYARPIQHLLGLFQLAVSALRAPTEPVVASATITQVFDFYQSVDSDQGRSFQQRYCLPENYVVAKIDQSITTENGPTKLNSVKTDVSQKNCVVLNADVQGFGVDRIGPIIVNYRGRGWLGVHLTVQGKVE
jgi:hypothetical protein